MSLDMRKKQIYFVVAITLVAIALIVFYVTSTIRSVNRKVEQQCFEELRMATWHLAEDFYAKVVTDTGVLKVMAAMMSMEDRLSDQTACQIMRSFDHTHSYVSYVELLRPDNTILDEDGTVRNVAGKYIFDAEAKKGVHISDMVLSSKNPSARVLCNVVPVIKDGRTAYLLIGVVDLQELALKYKTTAYGGNAYAYILNGDNGDFLVDLWHGYCGNFNAFSNRKMLPGYSFARAAADMKAGMEGNLGFTSKTTGRMLYAHYVPMNINNFSALVSVEEKYAMAKREEIRTLLYSTVGFTGMIFFVLMGSMLMSLFKAYSRILQLGMTDQNTGLLNRNAYDKFLIDNEGKAFPVLGCVYVDANGLHEINNKYGHAEGDKMLRTIADALKAEFSERSVYRVGGDEFIVFCEESDREAYDTKMANVVKAIGKNDYNISFGIVVQRDVTDVDKLIRETDERMLEKKRMFYHEHDRRGRAAEEST